MLLAEMTRQIFVDERYPKEATKLMKVLIPILLLLIPFP